MPKCIFYGKTGHSVSLKHLDQNSFMKSKFQSKFNLSKQDNWLFVDIKSRE